MKKSTILSVIFLTILIFIALNFRIDSLLKLKFFPKQTKNPANPITSSPASQELSSLKHKTTVILAGDVMLGRTVMIKSLNLSDGAYPFRKVADKLKSADIVFLNLENPITSDCPKKATGMIFCAHPVMLEGMVISDINIVSLANNHTKNFGQEGYESTKKYLSELGISWVDEKNLVIKEVNGIKIGFLGFDFTSVNPKEDDYRKVMESKNKVDLLILGIHWGVEYASKPNEAQRDWAGKFIESGADVIAGHHPHWVQGMEYISGKPVYYSLGNFIFDQMWSEETRKGIVVELTYQDKKLVDQKISNTYMFSWAQPEFVN